MSRRLLVTFLAVALVVLLLVEVPFAIFFGQRQRQRFVDGLERDAIALSLTYQNDIAIGATPSAAIAKRYAARSGARVVIVDPSGVSLVDTAEPIGKGFSNRTEVRAALSGTLVHGTRPSSSLGTDLVYAAVPLRQGPAVAGVLRVTAETSAVDRQVHQFWLALAGMAAVVIGVVAVAGAAVARGITRPLRVLDGAAERFAAGDLRATADVRRGPPELVDLAATMNQMARRLDALVSEQRAFVADASHQLRTPLTGMRLRLENLQARLDRNEVVDAADVEAAIDEVGRLTRLVGDLLQLARADGASARAVVDLAAVTRERVDTWQAMAELAEVTLTVKAMPDRAPVWAVPDAIEQVLDNSLDNALAVSAPGSALEVEVVADGANVVARVIDHGRGMSDADKVQALQRFWRGASDTPGTGLGLPIAKALAVASGGDLTLVDTPGGGLTVALRLSAAG